eukprot:jgi/Tetstr1/462764/TSEL_007716.t1
MRTAASSGCRRPLGAVAERRALVRPRGGHAAPLRRAAPALGRPASQQIERRSCVLRAQRDEARDGDGERRRVYGERPGEWSSDGMPPPPPRPPPPPPPPPPGSTQRRPSFRGLSLPSGKVWQVASLALQASVRVFLILVIFATAIYLADSGTTISH